MSENDLDAMLAAAGMGPADEVPEGFRSGFVTLVGRPNVGKSTLVNQILGQKVSIVSDKPQTTRHQIRGVHNREDAQIVFVDTPGIHRPRTLMGERLNDTAKASLDGIDVACLLIEANALIGPGDRFIAEQLPKNSVLVLNKIDAASPEKILSQLEKASELGFDEYFPISARTGKGVDALLEYLVGRLPEGPRWYPKDAVSDSPEEFMVAELVREQLLAVTREELPHSIATKVTEWEWPRIRVEIIVERESQKGIVIGKGGSVLKEVGTRVRAQLPPGAFIELHVTVDRDWQSKAQALERLGY
ncbi:MAG TPA: GTPase Era [Microthrixaceae bacterium]|nr:GTPase Era [Microthrixaceae bacterium]